jgi:hypothetical protein
MTHIGERITERFSAFCESLGQAEAIDKLEMTPMQRHAQKADFFFGHRRFICEIKSLEDDTNDKVVKILLQAGVPLREGVFELTDVLKDRPDRKEVRRACINAMARAVSDGLAKANRQIRETKRVFDCPAADGMVVFLHGRVEFLNPDVILGRISQRLAKLRENGTPSHDHVSEIVLFSEFHKLKLPDGRLAAAGIPFRNTAVPDHFGVHDYARFLIHAWGKWNGRRNHSVAPSALY